MAFKTLRIFSSPKLSNGRLGFSQKMVILAKCRKSVILKPKFPVRFQVNDFPLFILFYYVSMFCNGWKTLGNIFSFYCLRNFVNKIKTGNKDFLCGYHFSL